MSEKLPPPKLKTIDPEHVLFGSIRIEWTPVESCTEYYIFRDNEPITNVDGWYPYAIVQHPTTYFEDENIENGATYFYAIQAVKDNVRSPLSNSEKVKVRIPPHLILSQHNIEEGAYYESISPKPIDEKIWQLARLQLIFEHTFPNRDLEYLKVKVKSLKRDLPEFNGLFYEPTESEIRERAEQIYYENLPKMEIDWQISERELIMKKLEELIEFENSIRQ